MKIVHMTRKDVHRDTGFCMYRYGKIDVISERFCFNDKVTMKSLVTITSVQPVRCRGLY